MRTTRMNIVRFSHARIARTFGPDGDLHGVRQKAGRALSGIYARVAATMRQLELPPPSRPPLGAAAPYADAAAFMIERSTSPAALGRPEAWADRRALVSRWLMRNGEERMAYRAAASHHLASLGYIDLPRRRVTAVSKPLNRRAISAPSFRWRSPLASSRNPA